MRKYKITGITERGRERASDRAKRERERERESNNNKTDFFRVVKRFVVEWL